VYTSSFHYERARSLEEAASMLVQLGEDAKPLAGGQSLIPLMKMRLSRPSALVDLNFVPNLNGVVRHDGELRIGALARHADIESSNIAAQIPIVHDCAAGIADFQVRNRGTVAGSLAEADPTGDWAPVMLCLDTEVSTVGSQGSRTLNLSKFFKDAYTTELAHDELIGEVRVKFPAKNSGGAYIAFKRCAPVYASASAAVQITLGDKDTCKAARIFLGCVGLMPVHAAAAERELAGKKITAKSITAAAEAAMAAAEPASDMRGSADYKRLLVRSLTRRAIEASVRRARGEKVEVTHEYVGR
jgi:aerobic carbon-monoxide dehydrogenase medium subunit